jgi:hypothetical protein
LIILQKVTFLLILGWVKILGTSGRLFRFGLIGDLTKIDSHPEDVFVTSTNVKRGAGDHLVPGVVGVHFAVGDIDVWMRSTVIPEGMVRL